MLQGENREKYNFKKPPPEKCQFANDSVFPSMFRFGWDVRVPSNTRQEELPQLSRVTASL